MTAHPDIPLKALSIMQPWAWLIVNGHKGIENRNWPTKYRGPVAIHAGKKVDADASNDVRLQIHPVTGRRNIPYSYPLEWQKGGIVGVAEVFDCVDASDDPWFVGRYGFLIRNARPVDFIPVRGALGFFDWRSKLTPEK